MWSDCPATHCRRSQLVVLSPSPAEHLPRWAAELPDDFAFSVKVPKAITHERRLFDPEEPLARFLDETEALGAERDRSWCNSRRASRSMPRPSARSSAC